MKVRWGQELRDPVKNAVGLFLVREVTGVGIALMLKMGNERLEGSELRRGAELVAVSLQNEDGAGDAWEKFAEGKDFRAEGGGPLGPGGKDLVGMLVVVGEALLKFAAGIGGGHSVDEFAGSVAGDDEGALEDEGADAAGGRGVKHGDAGAFAVTVEDGVGDVEVIEERGDDGVDLVQVVGVGALGEGPFGVAVAGAGVGDDVVAGGVGELVGKLLPVADRAESFVQQEDGAVRCGERVVGDLDVLAVEREMKVLGMERVCGGMAHRDSIQMTLVCEFSQAAKRGE